MANPRAPPRVLGLALSRPHLVLARRPRGARRRLVAALEHVRGRGADAPAAAVAAPTPAGPPAPASPDLADAAAPAPGPPRRTDDARLDEAEETLRRLRAWRDEGLITPDEYEAKRRALLEGL
ncbi:MAG: hypothetical protein M9894_20785 [Planctomycetes bacterium]|nr:hypothetical protein [Planctomycetota bacterium]